MIPVVDSHCHLDFPELSADLPAVIDRAAEAGVRLMVTISTRVRRFDAVLRIAERFDNVYCSIGTHPHNAAEEPEVSAEELVALTRHPKVVAIGESGLDFHYQHSPREAQARSFRVHIEAARRSGLPLIVHSREAEDDTAAIIEEETAAGTLRVLLHCFSSKAALADRGLAAGCFISFSGILTFRNTTEIETAARLSPLDRLLVETDAPYLAPVPKRGKSNEPAFVVHTLRKLAEIKSVTPEEMARATNRNFFRLFCKIPVPSLYVEPRSP
ncbi:MAG: TatD family hydrolase [Pseudomonadota bacterium]|nr:TatD family hydrolase [Pseudomonadota bacterium]